MKENAFTFGGHFGRGVDIFRSVNEVNLQYGFVGRSKSRSPLKIKPPVDFEISISKADAIKLATRLLNAAEE